MMLMFTPSWPAAWTEASAQLLVAVLALVLIRVAGWFPFGGVGRARVREQALSGAALCLPSLIVSGLFAPPGAILGFGVVSLFPLIVLLPLAVVLGVGGYRSGKKEQGASPLEVTFGQSVAGWSLYLVGYEALFRGTLLFALFRAAGAWPAIVISTAVYALAHLDKRPAEILGSIPLGVIWGMACLEAGGLWPALMCHVAVAVGFDRGLASVR